MAASTLLCINVEGLHHFPEALCGDPALRSLNPTMNRTTRPEMGWTAHQWQAWSFPALTLLAMLGGVILWDGGVAHLSACPAQQMAFLAVNGGSTILPAWFWYGLTGLGDAAVLMPALALLTLRKPQAWAAVVASVPTAALMSVLGKHWSAVARPAAVLDASSFTLIGEALRYNSFPSGHSITVFAAAAAVLGSGEQWNSQPT